MWQNVVLTFLATESVDNVQQWDNYVYTWQCNTGSTGSHVSESVCCETAIMLKSLLFL
jgi:hypothetical protein